MKTDIRGVFLVLVLITGCRFPQPADVPDDDVVGSDGGVDAAPGCRQDSECEEGVCDHGVCAPVGTVLFVRPDGLDSGNGCASQASPCQTVTRALANVPLTDGNPDANHRYIKLMSVGSYREPDTLIIEARTVTIVGARPLATDRSVISTPATGDVVEVIGATVRFERLEVANAIGASSSGISCRPDVENAAFVGNDIVIYFNMGIGIDSDTCAMTLTNSLVSANRGGGIRAQSGRVVLVNNIITSNGVSGTVGSELGGILVNSLVGASSIIESNTIVANQAGMGFPDGVACMVGGLTVRNHIITGRATAPRVGGACAFTHTLYGPDDPGGRLGMANGNSLVLSEADFRFANPSLRDFHILPTSVAKGKGTVSGLAPEAMTDVDGEPRPQGMPDVGADEIPD